MNSPDSAVSVQFPYSWLFSCSFQDSVLNLAICEFSVAVRPMSRSRGPLLGSQAVGTDSRGNQSSSVLFVSVVIEGEHRTVYNLRVAPTTTISAFKDSILRCAVGSIGLPPSPWALHDIQIEVASQLVREVGLPQPTLAEIRRDDEATITLGSWGIVSGHHFQASIAISNPETRMLQGVWPMSAPLGCATDFTRPLEEGENTPISSASSKFFDKSAPPTPVQQVLTERVNNALLWRDSPKSVFNLISVTDTTAAGDDSPGYRVDDYVKSVTKRYDAVGNARAEALFAIKQGAAISSTIDDKWPPSNRKSCLIQALQHGVDPDAAFDAYWPLAYLHCV